MLLRAVIAICLLAGTSSARPRIVFTGNANIPAAELSNAIADPFDASGALLQEVLERDLLVLAVHYWDRGYARVHIGDPKIGPSEIIIPITENEVFRIGNVAITGDAAPRMKARHHDALTTRAGMLFSRTQIAQDRERLSRYYEERGYAYVNVLPLTKVDVAKRTVGLTFEIDRGKVAHVERAELDCPAVPDAATVLVAFAGDRYDVRALEASQAAIMELGRLGKDEVSLWMKRGSTDELVIVGVECH